MAQLDGVLRDFFKTSRLPVLFVGAGAGVHAGLPDWRDYLVQLAELARPHDPYTRHQMVAAVEERAFEDAAAYYFLCRKMPDTEKFTGLAAPLEGYESQNLKGMMSLPVSACVTTNFDRSLFDAYASVSGRAAQEVNANDPTLSRAPFESKFFIARIHGRVEVPESLVLTRDALQKAAENQAYVQLLTHIFTRRQVLFVGFSFLDPAIINVLKIVRKHFGSFHEGRHVALLPSDADSQFVQELERYGIKRVLYDPADMHRELWQAIDAFSLVQRETGTGEASVSDEPFALARRYLATCYARTKLANKLEPLWHSIVEGIVSAFVQQAGNAGISISDLVAGVRAELTLDEVSANELVQRCLALLLGDGLCEFGKDGARVNWLGNGTSDFEDSLGRLVGGVIDRYRVREGGQDNEANRACVKEFFKVLVLQRGWDLGAAFASHKVPENIDIDGIMHSLGEFRRLPNAHHRAGLTRACSDLLTKPDDEEARILAELGRLSFGLELVLQAPHDALFHKLTLPERIYLDAIVLMPAITNGHPFNRVYNEAISALQKAAASSLIDVGVYAYNGFLNEIVSHRKLALEQVASYGNREWSEIERQVRLYGTANVNVYVGAYANMRFSQPTLTFAKFISDHAPYDNEIQLANYLRSLGIRVIKEPELLRSGSEYSDVLLQLEMAYADKLAGRRKAGLVIKHDAVQLAGINCELKIGKKAVFVTADQTLRAALEGTRFDYLSNQMISHVGLAQLIDLLVGQISDRRGLSGLMWTTRLSSETDRVRNYLIDKALAEHDSALAMKMYAVVDEVSEDAGFELEKKKLSLESKEASELVAASRVIESYEEQFFRKMRDAMEKEGKK